MIRRHTTNNIVVTCLAIALVGGAAAAMAAQASGGNIEWLSYAEGRQRSQSQQKKVFLFFRADWCRYCLKMEKETFSDSAVAAYVNQNFVPVSVNSDKQGEIAAKYNVRGIPSTWFISEKGERIGNRPGYIPTPEMLNILKYINTDSYLTMSYKEFVKQKAR